MILTNFELNELDTIQNEAARIVTGTTKLTSIENLLTDTDWQTMGNRRKIRKLILMYTLLYSQTPSYLYSLLPENNNSSHQRNCHARTDIFYNSYFPSTLRLWNELSESLRNAQSRNIFKRMLHYPTTKHRP